jgi:hypothetical protein
VVLKIVGSMPSWKEVCSKFCIWRWKVLLIASPANDCAAHNCYATPRNPRGTNVESCSRRARYQQRRRLGHCFHKRRVT